MSSWTLEAVVDAMQAQPVGLPDLRLALTGPVVVDSRQVQPGGLFVALPGERADGADFAAQALADGAIAVVAPRALPDIPTLVVDDPLQALGRLAAVAVRRLPAMTVVGVTGSNGKTTTKDLLAHVLGQHGATVAAPGSYNGEIGLPLSVLRATDETRFLVLEYGARGVGHIAYLTRIARPHVAVVLTVGVAHIGVFGGADAIAKAKGELVEAVPDDGVAVLNADDERVREMRGRTAARVVTFGRGRADVCAVDVVLDDQARAHFSLTAHGVSVPVRLRIHGEHQVTNALATAAVALSVGMPLPAVASALSSAEPTSRWRMEVVTTEDGVTVINDAYNANPDSMAAGVQALVRMAEGRRSWAVLGAMAELGDATAASHRELGRQVASAGVDRLLAVGANADDTVAGAHAVSAGTVAASVPDVDAALGVLRAELATGDVVLVKASRSAGLERVAEALVAGTVAA